MHEEVLTNLHTRMLASMRMPSLAGHGLPERMRSTAFAFLGLTAAAGLALVALFAQPTFSLLTPAPMPSDPSRANAVAEAAPVASHSALGDSIPAPRSDATSGEGSQVATSKPALKGSDGAPAAGGGSPQSEATGGVGSPSTGGGTAAAPPQSSPVPTPAPTPEPAAAPSPTPAPEPAPATQQRPQASAPSDPSTPTASPGRSTAAVSPTRGNSSGSGASKGPPPHAASVRKAGATAAPAPAPPAAPAAAPAATGGPPAHSAAGDNGNGKALGHDK